jgi:WD40 repeat protein
VGIDNKVKVWDLSSGKILEDFTMRLFGRRVSFSPDGKMVAATDGNRVAIFDLSSRRQVADPNRCQGADNGLAWSPVGQLLALGDQAGGVMLYDTNTWDYPKAILQRGHQNTITGLALSPDGRTLLSVGHDHTLRRWDLSRPGENQIVHRFAQGEAFGVVYRPDGKQYATWEWGARPTIVWDAATNEKQCEIDLSFACVFSPDGKSLAGGKLDGTECLCDTGNGTELFNFGHPGGFAAFSPDGKRLASVCIQGEGRMWDVQSGIALGSWQGGRMISVDFSPDGKTLAIGSSWDGFTLWDTAEKKKLRTWPNPGGELFWVQFMPDGKTVFSASMDGTLRLWNLEWERPRAVIPVGVRLQACVLDPSGKYAIVGGNNQAIYVLRLPDSDAARP